MDRINIGAIEIRVAERRVLVGGQPVSLGSRAFDLLLALAERRDRVATKDELLEAAWPGLVVEENNLSVQVSAIRRALGPGILATVAGRGYRLTGVDNAAPGSPLLGNLPPALPRLFGRDGELASLVAALDGSALLTLCGPGGIGKTLLALHAARAIQPRFPAGAWLVDLSTVTDGAAIPDAVASCLGIRWQSGRGGSMTELADALRPREALLVLDNCEHVIEAVAALALSVRGAVHGLRILSTSQEPLHIGGEELVRLSALAVPDSEAAGDPLDFGAVRLFVERVRALQGAYDPDASEVADAVSICRRLDGNALAIGLAASRVPVLGSAGVLSHLSECLHWTAPDHRGVVPRHRTLHQALDWSYGLLGASSQAVFRKLGVFVGGFSLEAAEHVLGPCLGNDAGAEHDHLVLLVDRSLLTVESGRRPRYRMLETTREFALRCLGDAGERDLALREHAHAMRDLCLRAARKRDLHWTWLEMPNLRAAMRWALETPGEGEVAVALATYPSVLLPSQAWCPRPLPTSSACGTWSIRHATPPSSPATGNGWAGWALTGASPVRAASRPWNAPQGCSNSWATCVICTAAAATLPKPGSALVNSTLRNARLTSPSRWRAPPRRRPTACAGCACRDCWPAGARSIARRCGWCKRR